MVRVSAGPESPIRSPGWDSYLRTNAASGGLPRICELLGITVETALRYLPEPNLSANAL